MPSGSGSDKFANPWNDIASDYAPTTIESAFELCEFLYLTDTTYKRASERIVNYFLTDFKLDGQAGDEMDKFKDILSQDFDMMGTLQSIGYDYMCYGNSLSTISFPFVRTIACPKCEMERNITHVHEYKYDLKTGKIETFCPKCKSEYLHTISDYKKKDSKSIKLIRWNPKLVKLRANRLTADCEYWTDIPPEIKAGIKANDKFYINTTPKQFMDAARQDKKFMFNKGHIHHMKEPFLAGLWLGGWGLPSILSSFKNFFRLQTLRRYDEALMMDYIVPIRILSPRQGSYQEGNSIYNNMMSNWKEKMAETVQRHRQDSTTWNFYPFPVEYQAIGGDGRSFSPKEHIATEEDSLLNGRGIPPELYRSTMTLQAAPIALRVFEMTWSSLVKGFNSMAQELTDSISKYMGSGDYECSITSVKIIDDLENKAWRLQAMAAGQLSKATAMTPMGISDVTEEYRKVLEEQRRENEISKEMQQEMEMAEMGLGQSEEGQENQGQGQEGGGGITPENINAQGDQMARELLQMPEPERRRQLRAIAQQNDALHAVVLKRMDIIRNQARSMGMGQAMGQAVEQTPPPPPPPQQ